MEGETMMKGAVMRIFVAGATGAIGKRLIPMLVERGHEVTGMTRSEAKADLIRSMGARPAMADALDADAVGRVVAEAEPEVVVHQLTALSDMDGDMRHFERAFEGTNRLRTEGIDILLAAARAVDAGRFVAQSYAGWPYARVGGWIKTEDDPLDPDPFPAMRSTLAAIRHVERAVTEAEGIEGIALRYGGFYGPGTSLSEGGVHLEAVRQRKFPVVGNGAGLWSFLHIDDAATATVAAIEHGRRGVYNVVDDEPAPTAEWVPVLADIVGAKPPRHAPKWLARLLAGKAGVAMMTEGRGASNAKARRELGWEPRWPTWRQGFRGGLGTA
jgi:nucleoside-diphosphate-sugar epimerase